MAAQTNLGTEKKLLSSNMKMQEEQLHKKEKTNNESNCRFLSPHQLATRWDCSRTTAQRIADRVGISRYYLGEGRNGLVRYAVKEIEAFESSRRSEVNHSR